MLLILYISNKVETKLLFGVRTIWTIVTVNYRFGSNQDFPRCIWKTQSLTPPEKGHLTEETWAGPGRVNTKDKTEKEQQ